MSKVARAFCSFVNLASAIVDFLQSRNGESQKESVFLCLNEREQTWLFSDCCLMSSADVKRGSETISEPIDVQRRRPDSFLMTS